MLLTRVTYGHDTYVLNEHYSTAGVLDRTKVQNTVVIRQAVVSPQFRRLSEPLHVATGGTAGRVHRGMLYLRMAGAILVPDATQLATLSDRERAFRHAFDPAACYADSPTTEGVYPLDWSEYTTDTTNYATGLIYVRRYGRPMTQPETAERIEDGPARNWTTVLECIDPRLYEQTEQTLTLTPASASGNAVNKGNIEAPLKATITMAGAGNAAFTITRGGVSFILNLSTCSAGNVVVVVMETCGPYGRGKYITKAGVEAFSLKTSAATTWLNVPVGTTSFSISNHTNVTSCVLGWYHTRA